MVVKVRLQTPLPKIVAKSLHPADLMDAFINRIRNRVMYTNDDYRGLFVGMTGTGKSVSAVSLAYMLDPNFNVDNVFFDPGKLIKKMKEAAQEAKLGKKILKGKCIVFDEAGVAANARSWQSAINKALSYLAQTQRYLNCVVLFTLPSVSMLDKQIRTLFHNVYFVYKRIKTPLKIYSHTRSYVYDVMTNPISNFIEDPHQRRVEASLRTPIVKVKNVGSFYLDTVNIHLPPKRLIDEYELKKAYEMEKLYNELEKAVGLQMDPKEQEEYFDQLVNRIVENVAFFRTKAGKISVNKIKKEFGVDLEVANLIKNLVEQKLSEEDIYEKTLKI